jgi:hypothetical protein
MLVQYHSWFRRKTLKRSFTSTNYKYESTGAGLSYSGRNGQLPWKTYQLVCDLWHLKKSTKKNPPNG